MTGKNSGIKIKIMKEELITYDTAVLAKEKGFNIECLHFYTKPNSKMFGIDEHGRSYPIKNKSKSLYVIGEHATLNIKSAFYVPSQSLLQRWLREVHNIHVFCCLDIIDKHGSYWVEIGIKDTSTGYGYKGVFETELNEGKTYEEVLEIGLYQALKLIK